MAISTLTNENREEYNAGKGFVVAKDETPHPADTPKEVEAAGEPEKPEKKRHSVDERLSKLADQKREALAAAEQAKKDAADARAALDAYQKANQPKDGKPKAEDFTDAVKYAEALADWRFGEKLKEQSAKDAADKAAAEAQRIAAEWQKKVKKASKEIEDYDEVTEAAADMPISYALRDAIVDSDIGPRMHYYLAQNPELVEEMNAMPVAKMHRYFGKLEARLEAQLADKKEEKEVKEELAPRKRIADAPEPITPVKGIGSVTAGNVNGDGKVINEKQFRTEMRKKIYGH